MLRSVGGRSRRRRPPWSAAGSPSAGGFEPGEEGSHDYTQAAGRPGDRRRAGGDRRRDGQQRRARQRGRRHLGGRGHQDRRYDGRRAARRELCGRGDRGRHRGRGRGRPATEPHAASAQAERRRSPAATRRWRSGRRPSGRTRPGTSPRRRTRRAPAAATARARRTARPAAPRRPATTGPIPSRTIGTLYRPPTSCAGRVVERGVGGRDRHQLHDGEQHLADQGDPGADAQRPRAVAPLEDQQPEEQRQHRDVLDGEDRPATSRTRSRRRDS